MTYAVYYSGDVYDNNGHCILKITDENIIEYIFGRVWNSKKSKKELDKLIEEYPDSFYEKIRDEEKRDKALQKFLNKVVDKERLDEIKEMEGVGWENQVRQMSDESL